MAIWTFLRAPLPKSVSRLTRLPGFLGLKDWRSAARYPRTTSKGDLALLTRQLSIVVVGG